MSSQERRAADRRRAWGRGPVILKLEALERREVLSAASVLPDLVGSSLSTQHNADWNQSVQVEGEITNQGGSAVTIPFNVELYASPSPALGRYAVPIGMATISGGIAAGQTVPFTTTVKLPTTPLPGVKKTGVVFVNMKVDPNHLVTEGNTHNQQGLGMPYESSFIVITPQQPPKLVGSTFAISTPTTTWGSTVTVTAQVRNQSAGEAPATRALLVLTPTGRTPQWPNDVAVGNLNVPAIPPWQTVNLVQNITLPASVPTLLTGDSSFTLSMIQDADYITNAMFPHLPTVGSGYDQAGITINTTSTTPAAGPLADLAASSVLASTQSLTWGSSFQVTTTVQNLGQANAGPFTVRFLLVGQNGSINQGLFLGDAHISGLQAGFNQQVVQSLTLPDRLPAGMTLNSIGWARIAVIVDAENTVNESLVSNNLAESAPMIVRLPGTNGTSTVPNSPVPGQLPSLAAQPAPLHKHRLKPHYQVVAHHPNVHPAKPHKLYRKVPRKGPSLYHELTVFPKQVNNLIKKYV